MYSHVNTELIHFLTDCYDMFCYDLEHIEIMQNKAFREQETSNNSQDSQEYLKFLWESLVSQGGFLSLVTVVHTWYTLQSYQPPPALLLRFQQGPDNPVVRLGPE